VPAFSALSILSRSAGASLLILSFATEFLEPPALKDLEIADPGGERFEIVASGNEARSDPAFLGADLEKQLQQVADERAVLGQAGPARLPRGQFVGRHGFGGFERFHQPGADIVAFPPG
jgi:hypothetical protein